MTEQKLIELLADESERMDEGRFEEKVNFDTEICAWKDEQSAGVGLKRSVAEPVRFRIRTVESRGSLTRSASTKSHLSTVSSSGGSQNASPRGDNITAKKAQAKPKCRKDSLNLVAPCENIQQVNIVMNAGFNIHTAPKQRRQRKPVKVFKLPRVDQGNEE